MQFQGERELSRLPAELWDKLSDLRFLVECIPGAEKFTEVKEDHAECSLRPGFSFVRGVLNLSIDRKEANPPNSVEYLLASKGIGSSSDVITNLEVSPKDSGSLVKWTASIQNLGGLLKAVPKGLIQGAAQKVIGEMWDNIETKLSN